MEKLKSTMMLFVIKKRKLKTEAFESLLTRSLLSNYFNITVILGLKRKAMHAFESFRF